MNVRFVDPETGLIVHPEPFETPSKTGAPRSGTKASSTAVGAPLLHPLLTLATFPWDVRNPLQSCIHHWAQLERNQLGESATTPPTTWLDIRSPHIPWRIEIRPNTPNPFITVYDAMSAIQAALMPEICPEEWRQFESAGKHLVLTTRDARVRSCDPEQRLDEAFNHPRRIDSLGELTRFGGLTPTPRRTPNSFDVEFRRRS